MERVVQTLAEGAANLGHHVEVVAVESIGRQGAPVRQRSRVTRAFSFAALGSQEIAPGYIAAAWKRADVIHLHHPHPLADLACLLRAGRTPVVVTQHADALRSLRLLYVDCGTKDEFHLHHGARRFVRELSKLGIAHHYEEFDDGHMNVPYRYDTSLPMLARALGA